MVVDDDEYILRLVTTVLHRQKYTVVAFEQPVEALELLEHVTPDLFILDHMMPQMNGLELCQRIRSCEPTAQVPIIMLSAQYNSAVASIGLKAGANIYLPKHAISSDLTHHIQELLAVENAQC